MSQSSGLLVIGLQYGFLPHADKGSGPSYALKTPPLD